MYPAQAVVSAAAIQAHTLPVSEVFGPTLQGEGPHTGRRVFFLRLGGCNLHCSWCDTPYTWDTTRYDVKAECPDTTMDVIHARLRALGARPGSTIVLSGGEPLIHHHKLHRLMSTGHYDWHVESNGTVPPPSWWGGKVEHTTLSPKVGQDDDPLKRRLPRRSLEAWARHTYEHDGTVAWKFVCRDSHDLDTADSLVQAYGVHRSNVWIMPEGTTPERILQGQRALAPAVLALGYNLTTRLHTLLWGETRGR